MYKPNKRKWKPNIVPCVFSVSGLKTDAIGTLSNIVFDEMLNISAQKIGDYIMDAYVMYYSETTLTIDIKFGNEGKKTCTARIKKNGMPMKKGLQIY